ncbi:MAG: hypothetical protein EOL87_16535 [Spartobacteria bacterium]|nr:hypothetical protein [Spartobacteria bacterium]
MNINEINQGRAAGAPLSTGAVRPVVTPRVPSSNQSGIAQDRVDTSVFSRLMAKGVSELQEYLQPRAEKVAQFKGTLDSPVSLSDEVIDTVMRRMISA